MDGVEGDEEADRSDCRRRAGGIARPERRLGPEPDGGRQKLGHDERPDAVGPVVRVDVDQERARRERGEQEPLVAEGLDHSEHAEHGSRREDGEREVGTQAALPRHPAGVAGHGRLTAGRRGCSGRGAHAGSARRPVRLQAGVAGGERKLRHLRQGTRFPVSSGSSMTFPLWLQSGLWGLLSGSALVLGAAVAYLAPVPQRVVAGVMAFGSGVLVSALTFGLVEEAIAQGGLLPVAVGFAAGALVYTGANVLLDRAGATHRKRSGEQQTSESEQAGSGAALAVGALLDGVPESIAIGLSLLAGGGVSVVTVAAIFLSNIPEGLSSAAGMKKAGRSARYIFGVWAAIALASAVAAVAGVVLFAGASPAFKAGTTAVAAGAILAMLADTMVPEATAGTHAATGLIVALGFLAALALDTLAG